MEAVGWVFIAISIFCGLGLFTIAAGSAGDPDRMSEVVQNPLALIFIFIGLAFGFTGMYLVGMFSGG